MCDPRFRWMPEHSMHIKMPKLSTKKKKKTFTELCSVTLRSNQLPLNTYFKLAHSGCGASQSAQHLLPGTRSFIVWMVAKSLDVGFALVEIFACNVLKISCSITCTHSSRSSMVGASKCHCLPSSETMKNSYASASEIQTKRNQMVYLFLSIFENRK